MNIRYLRTILVRYYDLIWIIVNARKTSLNLSLNKRVDQRIQKDNLLILKRLEDQSSVYSHLAWKKDWHKRKKILKNISTFQKPNLFHSRKLLFIAIGHKKRKFRKDSSPFDIRWNSSLRKEQMKIAKAMMPKFFKTLASHRKKTSVAPKRTKIVFLQEK
jgi:hypothetical protein